MAELLVPTRLRLDVDQAKRFLDTLVGSASNDEEFTFQTLDDDQTRKDPSLINLIRGPLEDVAERLEGLNQRGAGVYVTVNKIKPGRRVATNVTGIRALFIDLDGGPLEPVRDWALPPHIVVESSPGKFHVYWRADGSVRLEDFATLQRKLATVFNSDPSVSDLPRILRLPGAWHQKVRRDGTRSEPFMTRIIHSDVGSSGLSQ
ncbi:MAG: DNA-primase RepB domain-containing protein [Xanthobacteraceae bacterium]